MHLRLLFLVGPEVQANLVDLAYLVLHPFRLLLVLLPYLVLQLGLFHPVFLVDLLGQVGLEFLFYYLYCYLFYHQI